MSGRTGIMFCLGLATKRARLGERIVNTLKKVLDRESALS